MVSREAAKARSPRRKPWVTECLRELSREAANTLRGKHNPWANAHGYVLSPLRGYKQCIFKTYASGYEEF